LRRPGIPIDDSTICPCKISTLLKSLHRYLLADIISLSNLNCLARFLPRVYLLMQSCRNLPHPYLAAKPYREESCITWIADGDPLTVPSRCSPSSWCRSPGLPSSASIGLACRLCYKTREPFDPVVYIAFISCHLE